MNPALDVVLVAYNSESALRRSIPAAARIPGAGQIVVVDNGTDASSAVAAELGADVVAFPGNPGFGRAQNQGVRRGCAPLLLLLNPDAEPDPDGVAAGMAYLEAHPRVAAVQGVIVNRLTGLPERSQGVELGPLHLLGRALHLRPLAAVRPVRSVARRVGVLRDHVERIPERPTGVETLAATSLLVRREAFDAVGGFDERFFLYGEDLDLCRRLRGAGWGLVALPDRWAMHTSGESSATSFEREWVWWRGTLQFAAYWWRRPAWSVAVVAAAIQVLKFCAVHPGQSRQRWRGMVGWALQQRRAAGWGTWTTRDQ